MKKNNTKVELKKYLSQKEKIKNTFISSCIILVVLTFFIFITYSYFIEKTGEIDVGNVQTAMSNSDVTIIKRGEEVPDSNNQQYIYTIKNKSNTNTYSYNLSYQDKSSGRFRKIYYKIPSKEYSHPEGIIKPGEEKKIYLIFEQGITKEVLGEIYNQNGVWNGTTGPFYFKVFSNYEYTPPKVEEDYVKIEYSPLSETTELTDLKSYSVGYLIPLFNSNTLTYDLYLPEYYYDEAVYFKPTLTNNGKVLNNKIDIYDSYRFNREIKVYAEDGTYVKSYKINNINKKEPKGNIYRIWMESAQGKVLGEAFPGKLSSNENSKTINVTLSVKDSETTENYIYFNFTDFNNYLKKYYRNYYVFSVDKLVGNNYADTSAPDLFDPTGKMYESRDSLKFKLHHFFYSDNYQIKIYINLTSSSNLLKTYNVSFQRQNS